MADGIPPPTNPKSQTLHITDSESNMEDLFSVLTKKKVNNNTQLPYIKRDLPASFFNPSLKHGSNENFVTSGFTTLETQTATPPVLHTRSRSSPAQIQHPLSVPTAPPVQHVKQASMGDFIGSPDSTPLPQGWEIAFTDKGVRYFINHNKQITSWADPRKPTIVNNNNVPVPGTATTVVTQPVLPPAAQTPPVVPQRMSQQQQQQPAQEITVQQQIPAPRAAPQVVPPATAQTGPGQQQIPVPLDIPQQAMANLNISMALLPPGWEQSATAQGEIYFINHNDKTTSWTHPREMAGLKLNPAFPPQAVAAAPGAPLPVQQFRPVSKASQLVVSVTPGMSPSSSQTVTPTHSPQPSHVHPTSPAGSVTDLSTDKLRLQRLQMQRQHIQREEEELYKKVQLQEILERQHPSPQMGGLATGAASQLSTSTGSLNAPIVNQKAAMMNSEVSGMDPFLGQGNPQHPRQNSGDSGVGGMGCAVLSVANENMDQDARIDMKVEPLDIPMDNDDLITHLEEILKGGDPSTDAKIEPMDTWL